MVSINTQPRVNSRREEEENKLIQHLDDLKMS
jgi:hypothetical protein